MQPIISIISSIMIPVSLNLLITGLFIAWFFNSLVGIFGLSFILIFYWIIYLRELRSSRKMILPFKEDIITYFSDFKGKSGHEHFDYVYNNAQFFLTARSARLFARVNYFVRIGCIIMGLYSIWFSDWSSLLFCIVLIATITILSSIFNKPLKELKIAKHDSIEFENVADTLASYSEFFVNQFPQMINKNFKRDNPDFPKFNP